MRRPERYSKLGEPWVQEFLSKHQAGWSAQQIADHLNDWQKQPPWWTARKVYYHRNVLRDLGELPPARTTHRHPEYATVHDARAQTWRTYAAAHGWAHLLPATDEDTGAAIPGIELRPRDVDVLDALLQHGPLTRVEIADVLGIQTGTRSLGIHVIDGRVIDRIGNLVKVGLVRVTDRKLTNRGWRCVYALADGILPRSPHVRETSVERLARLLATGSVPVIESE